MSCQSGVSGVVTPDPSKTLTEAQKQVLRLVARGMTSKEIAIELGISVASVNDRVEGARAKLGDVRRSTAARWLVESEHPNPFGAHPKPFGLTEDGGDRHPAQAADGGGEVRETRAVFADGPADQMLARMGILARTGLIIVFTIALLIAAALIKPMLDGMAWLAHATTSAFR